MKVIAFIIHGKIKHRDRFVTSANQFFSRHYRFIFFITEHKGHSVQLAYEAVKEGAEYVVSVGGDGSLNEVVNGVMQARNEPWVKNVKIGVLPYGTGNDFARTVGATASIARIKELIDTDSYQPIDLGLAEYKDEQGQSTSRYFINITDVGIGGFIARELANSSKFFGATITYQKAIISALLSYRNQPVKMVAGAHVHEGEVMELVIGNGKFLGGGLDIVPDAKVDDGLFSIAIAGKISIFTYLRNFINLMRHKKIEHSQVKYLSSKDVTVESPSPQPIDMDGEFVGYTPLKVHIIPKAISFLY